MIFGMNNNTWNNNLFIYLFEINEYIVYKNTIREKVDSYFVIRDVTFNALTNIAIILGEANFTTNS